jgi:hypothetical protein
MNKILIMVTAVLLVWATEASGDPTAANKWVRDAPSDINATNLTDMIRVTDRVRRNQTVYFMFEKTAAGFFPLVDGATASGTPCTAVSPIVATPTNGCTTAPLFIAAPSALVCTSGNMATSGIPANLQIESVICNVESPGAQCARNTSSVPGPAWIVPTDTENCAEVNGTGNDPVDNLSVINAGGNWIYLRLTSIPTANGFYTIWVTGR